VENAKVQLIRSSMNGVTWAVRLGLYVDIIESIASTVRVSWSRLEQLDMFRCRVSVRPPYVVRAIRRRERINEKGVDHD